MIVKSCPFCGGRPRLETHQRGFVNGVSTKVCYVYCSFCNARSMRVDLAAYGRRNRSADAIRDVVDAWNDRAEGTKEYNLKGDDKIYELAKLEAEHCQTEDDVRGDRPDQPAQDLGCESGER